MAKLCTTCGKLLPREDARFCNNCGSSVVPSLPGSGSAPTRSAASGEPLSNPPAPARPPLKEQIAFPSPSSSRPGRPDRPVPDNLPAHLYRLENSVSAVSPAPLRELRVKVWDTADSAGALNENMPAGGPTPEVPQTSASNLQEVDLVDLPTSQVRAAPLVAVPVNDEPGSGAVQRGGVRASRPGDWPDEPARQPAGSREHNTPSDEVEQLETRPMQSQQPRNPVSLPQASSGSAKRPWETQPTLPLPPQQPRPLSNGDGGTYSAFGTAGAIGQREYQQFPANEEPALPIVSAAPFQHPVVQSPRTPLPVSRPAPQPAQQDRQAEQAARTVSHGPADGRPVRRRGRTRLLVVTGLLVVLLVGGFAVWLVAAHPFDVPGVTSTSVSFQNASLGVSLQYPQGWTSQFDSRHGAASFFDPNHTDQFNLNTVTNSALSVDQYIKNTTGQLGMTGQKNLPPLTFAGQSWRQVRGSVLVSGATYTETLLVTTHAGRLYALLLMAPASTYNDADRLFFAPMRSSFHFV